MKYKKTRTRELHDFVNSPTYVSWYNMKNRCNNPNIRDAKHYFSKNIRYPERWESFLNFLEDMGVRPDGTTLDRIDSNKSYSKDNCRWATKQEQSSNTSRNIYLEHQGLILTIQEWSRVVGIERKTLSRRIERGWLTEDALLVSPDIYHRTAAQ